MKILIFSLTYLPFIGGAELAVKEITDRIDDIEFDLITVNLDGQQKITEKIGNINIYRLGKGKLAKYFFPFTAFKKAVELQQEKNYDLIWAIMANQAGLAALKFKKKFPKVKYLLTLQEGDSLKDIWLRTWFIRPLYKSIYRSADRIQAISQFLATRAKKLGARCQIDVIPNGIAWFVSTSGQRRHDGVIISVSRLTKKNGLADLIKAMQYIDSRTLKIIGDGELRPQLEALVKQLGLEQRVEFIGRIDYEEVHSYLREASVFVRPSLSEGLGSAFLEAMADKIPVIATPVGGIVDFLDDGKTGWFCRVKDPKDIAEKINFVLNPENKSVIDQVVNQANEMVTRKYRWSQIANQMKNIFNQI